MSDLYEAHVWSLGSSVRFYDGKYIDDIKYKKHVLIRN